MTEEHSCSLRSPGSENAWAYKICIKPTPSSFLSIYSYLVKHVLLLPSENVLLLQGMTYISCGTLDLVVGLMILCLLQRIRGCSCTRITNKSPWVPKPWSHFLKCMVWSLAISATVAFSKPPANPEIMPDNIPLVIFPSPPSLSPLTESAKEMRTETHLQWQRQEFAN